MGISIKYLEVSVGDLLSCHIHNYAESPVLQRMSAFPFLVRVEIQSFSTSTVMTIKLGNGLAVKDIVNE